MSENKNAPGTGRVVTAVLVRNQALVGTIDIVAHTKHGPTAMLSVPPSEMLEAGDLLKTQVRVLSAHVFVVLREHARPMKIPGRWYEVQVIKDDE